MAPVDLNKNRESILKAHKEVSDPHSKTNWALFGYEGQTDVIKVLSKGDGGLEELQDDLSSGKIMYAYVKILDPNTNLPKFVFINWQGEGVPEQRKGGCASHVRDVQNLLRGAHVSINARTEDDIDEKTVTQKVSKASGANYSFHKEEKKPMPAIGPVGSVYEKVRPQIEIKPDIREKFWENSEREEKQRILVEKQRQAQEKAKLDKESKDREAQETHAREQREAERIKKIREVKEAEKQASARDKQADKSHWAEVQREALDDDYERRTRADRLRKERAADESDAKRDEDERAKRSDEMRKTRAAEAKALVSGKTSGARSMFEQKPTSQFDQENKAPPPSRKLQQPAFLDNQPSDSTQRKQPIQLPKSSPSPPVSPTSPPARAPAAVPARAPAAVPPPRTQPAPPRAPSPAEELYEDAAGVQRDEPEDTYDDAASLQKPTGPQVRNLLAEGMPRRPPSDDEQEDQDWNDDGETITPAPVKAKQAEQEELYEDTSDVSHGTSAVTGGGYDAGEELYQDAENVASQQHQQQAETEELYDDAATTGSKVKARALYDYQAAEENEITFDPDDIIDDIEMIDEGWWIGTTREGQRGMFPSNYVELF